MHMLNIGERLRTARKEQNLSLRALAAKANVSASLLSQIENDHANPSVVTLFEIAKALSVPVHYFFPFSEEDTDNNHTDDVWAQLDDNGQDTSGIIEMVSDQLSASQDIARAKRMSSQLIQVPNDRKFVLRVDQRPMIELMGGVVWSRLTPQEETGLEFLEIRYEVGGTSGPAKSRHSGREFGLVLEGELRLELGFDEYLLTPGDSVIFSSAIPHRLSNAGDVPMQAVWVNIDYH